MLINESSFKHNRVSTHQVFSSLVPWSLVKKGSHYNWHFLVTINLLINYAKLYVFCMPNILPITAILSICTQYDKKQLGIYAKY